jgi:hypothetical protein
LAFAQALKVASPATLAHVTAPSESAAHPKPMAKDLNENFILRQSLAVL